MNRKDFKHYLKAYLFEIIAFLVAVLVLVQFINEDFSRALITSFALFRPENTRIAVWVFVTFTAFSILLIFVQARKKKLKSTKKLSAFAKTVERSHKIRAMSVTQVTYIPEPEVIDRLNVLPGDISSGDPGIVELYFDYEEKLSI